MPEPDQLVAPIEPPRGRTPVAMLRHGLPIAAIVIALCGFLLTLDRAPIAWADGVLYASIARSLATGHPGAPSVHATSPTPVDHVRFYGPVFFWLLDLSFRWLGFSLAGARLVSLFGAVLISLAGGLTVRALGGSVERQLWTSALLLFTPELGFSATNGRMDSVAVGLALLALGVYVRGLARGTAPLGHGVASGVLLGTAALTTPRVLPFVGVFGLAGGVCLLVSGPRRPVRSVLFAGAGVTGAALLCAWTLRAGGGPVPWMRYLASIIPAVGIDVALAPTAIRDWQVTPWRVLSSLAAALGGCVAVAGLWRNRTTPLNQRHAALFALSVTGTHFALVALTFNLTFVFATYFAIPLLAVVAALLRAELGPNRSVLRFAFAILLALDVGIRAGKYGGVALTWAARDPDSIERFVDTHVPDGSDVIGKASMYFFAVEASGSRMLRAAPHSYADWASWAPRAASAPRRPGDPNAGGFTRPRFFLWPADEEAYPLPPDYECTDRHLLAVYEPPADRLEWLGSLAPLTGIPGYPKSRLYELGPSCGNIEPRR